MRALLIVMLLSSVASADHFTSYGIGPAVAKNETGIVSRIEKRVDAMDVDDDEVGGIFGVRIGAEWWRAGGKQGFAMPVGLYAGGNVKTVRTSLGGGIGLWTFTGRENFGVSPFASSLLEVSAGKLVVTFDARLARQTVFNDDDFNVYSVTVSVGPRYR